VAYTSDDRAAGLAALQSNGGNLRRTARETGISDATLRRWRDETDARKDAANGARMPEARATLADRLREFVDAALTVAPHKLHEANLRDVFTSLGIAIDKLQLLEGKPTSIDEVRDGDGRRELDEVLAKLAARHASQDGQASGPN